MCEGKKFIILAGESGSRPEVISISDDMDKIKEVKDYIKNSAFDRYYIYPIAWGKIYTGPWGIDDDKSWIEKGEREETNWDNWIIEKK